MNIKALYSELWLRFNRKFNRNSETRFACYWALKDYDELMAVIKSLKKTEKFMKRHVFYSKHLVGFIISDRGKVWLRDRPLSALRVWAESNVRLWLDKLLGFKWNPAVVNNYFHIYFGLNSALKHSGLTSEQLTRMPLDSDIMRQYSKAR